jgi:hypothetical protein
MRADKSIDSDALRQGAGHLYVRAHINRLAALALLALVIGGARAADTPSFQGSWAVPLCALGDPEKCGGFELYLVQRGTRLCGDHFAATPGLGRLNEGTPRSVVGTVLGKTAIVAITSGRDGSILLAQIHRTTQGLRWTVVERVKKGEQAEDPLIPFSASLVLRASEQLERVTRECAEVLDHAP